MSPLQSTRTPHVVIVGGGFGGLYAARALAKAPVRVTIVDRCNYHLFQPLLYQVATAALSPRDIAQPIRSIMSRQANAQVVLGDVVSVDAAGGRVILSDGEIAYDRLILAAGARHSYFGRADWEQEAHGLKSLEDALEIRRRFLLAFEAAERLSGLLPGSTFLEATEGRREPEAAHGPQGGASRSEVDHGPHDGPSQSEADQGPQHGGSRPGEIQSLLTFVVVGGGPTGVELAGALAEIARWTLSRDFRAIDPSQARVVLIEAAPRILAAFPDSLSRSAAAQLERLGVEVKTSSKLAAILPGRGVRLENGLESANKGTEWIATRTVLWAAGVEASPITRSLGAPVDRAGRILVEANLSMPGRPEIQVIGDLASFVHQTGKPLPGIAPVAIQQGRHAAKNLVRSLRGEPALPFHYSDRGSLATIGRSAAVADFGRLRLSGFLAWVSWAFVHIFFLIGFKNRLLVMLEWGWMWFTYKRGARLITGVPGARRDEQAAEEPAGSASG